MSPTPPTCRLRLYVAGGAPRSQQAVEAVSRVCARGVPGKVDLQVVDVFRRPDLAREDGVVGVPALIRLEPPPVQRLVGRLTDESTLCSVILGASAQARP